MAVAATQLSATAAPVVQAAAPYEVHLVQVVALLPTNEYPSKQEVTVVFEAQTLAPTPHYTQVPTDEVKKYPVEQPVATVGLVHPVIPVPQATHPPFEI